MQSSDKKLLAEIEISNTFDKTTSRQFLRQGFWIPKRLNSSKNSEKNLEGGLEIPFFFYFLLSVLILNYSIITERSIRSINIINLFQSILFLIKTRPSHTAWIVDTIMNNEVKYDIRIFM